MKGITKEMIIGIRKKLRINFRIIEIEIIEVVD